jgi:hypothetical protein
MLHAYEAKFDSAVPALPQRPDFDAVDDWVRLVREVYTEPEAA